MRYTLKRAAVAAMLALLLLALAGQAMAALAAGKTGVKSIRLDRHGTVRLAIGERLTLTPTLKPDTVRARLTWRSSRRRVATVKNGVVTAKKTGTTRITVSAGNRKTASVRIKVYDPRLPAKVALNLTGTQSMAVGGRLQLTATLSPVTARSGLKWKSSNKKVARVSKDGVVTAKKAGKATITVTTRNNKKARVRIKVVKAGSAAVSTAMVGATTVAVTPSGAVVGQPADAGVVTGSVAADPERVAVLPGDAPSVHDTDAGSGDEAVTDAPVVGDSTGGVVVEEEAVSIVTPEGYNLPYVLYACKNSHTIAVLTRDETGAWKRVLRLFSTGMGRNNVTATGTYTIARKERWHRWSSGYSPYANKLSGGNYIHGPIYTSKNHYTIRPDYYNLIGTDCSSGCLRTTCACAGWVYYNCPVGTLVVIAQNSAFSAPRPAKLARTAISDPTDPGGAFEVLLTGFSTMPKYAYLSTGETCPITPVGLSPRESGTRGFTYASEDASVAAVSADGLVTAMGPGVTMIVVTAQDDYRCAVRVPVVVDGGGLDRAGLAAADTLDGLVPVYEDPAVPDETFDDGLCAEFEDLPESTEAIVIEGDDAPPFDPNDM